MLIGLFIILSCDYIASLEETARVKPMVNVKRNKIHQIVKKIFM